MARPRLTPMMRQYLAIKERYPDAILFFNLGDFYETFFEDAELASRELDLVLTKRNEAPMAGVPLKKAEVYINRLLKKGYKVAICDQLQDPQEARGLVERDVVRVVTPGTVLEEDILERGLNNYIAAVLTQAQGERLGLAVADLSTGEFRATELSRDELKDELARLQPAELILPQGMDADDLLEDADRRVAQTKVEENYFKTEDLLEHFGLASLEGLGLGELAGRTAAGLLKYLKETQKGNLAHLKRPQAYSPAEQMQLDPFTQRNLELVREFGGGTQNTLFSVLNRAVTGMGERLLRRWLLAPSLDREEIESRLDLVELFYNEGLLRAEMREFLKEIHDLERLGGRLGSGRANPRDLLSLGESLEMLPRLRELMGRLRAAGPPEILEELAATLDRLSLEDLAELLKRALREDAPPTLKEGGLIREGFDQELDKLKAQEREYKKKILELELKERERTGIPSLKVGYNTVFGYYIEVTKTHAKRVPKDYIRKQTLVNAERYITPELKEYEGKITSAAGRAMELEYEIFLQLRERVAARVEQIQELAGLIAQLDAFSALAEVAKANGYTRPHFTDRPVLEIRDGRHPVVERREEFVPNDLLLGEDEHLVVLTGPNMSGKCLTGDALVFTDRGLLPIIELMPQGLEEDQFKRIDLKVRGRNGIEGASHFYYGGIQETIRITTRLGYSIEGTKEHPIWVRDQTGREGWARLGELTEGDFVAIARDIDLWGDRVGIEFDEPPFDPRVKRYKVPKELNEDLAYLLGLLVGDGTLTYKNGYVISSGDDLVREEFARINLELFGYRVMTRGKETDLAVTSAYLRSFLSTLGLSYWKAYEKSIPRAILTAPKGIVAAFLRGLFDTDGYTEKRYGNIILSTSSARLAREVQLLLLNFGIVSSIKPEKTKARDNYLLSIFGENAIRFYQEIGFKDKKVITLKEAKGIDSIFYTCIPNGRNISHRKPKELITYCNLNGVDCHEFTRSREDRHFYDKVVRIELSKGPVYDLSVPDSHSFVANGFINHNSVYIRQIALIALMAQLGSFVPAREALLPIIDKIFTRVGASDMLTSGYSTFMVEMLETANILNNATPRSLIILDEMGRGTSTFDGVSIAWAVAEHLATKVKAKTLFATHYHELTRLAARVPGVKNMHVRVKEFGNEVIFLHRVAEGVAEGSYGVHVARLAGLPEEVTEKAAEILDQILKRNPLDAMGELRSKEPRFLEQLALFAAEEHPVIKRLISIDLDRLTPLEALELLMELKRELG